MLLRVATVASLFIVGSDLPTIWYSLELQLVPNHAKSDYLSGNFPSWTFVDS
jgi:hypothetical protein